MEREKLTEADLFYSEGVASDWSPLAKKFYEQTNDKLDLPNNTKGLYSDSKFPVKGDVVFNAFSKIKSTTKKVQDKDLLYLFQSMCYTALNKSFISSVGRGKNLNTFKNAPGNGQAYDRGDVFIYEINDYLLNINCAHLKEKVNESTRKFVDSFENTEIFVKELYFLDNLKISSESISQVLSGFLNAYHTNIKKKNYKKNTKHSENIFDNIDIQKFTEMEDSKWADVQCKLIKKIKLTALPNDEARNLLDILIENGSKNLSNTESIENYMCIAVLFWASRYQSICESNILE